MDKKIKLQTATEFKADKRQSNFIMKFIFGKSETVWLDETSLWCVKLKQKH